MSDHELTTDQAAAPIVLRRNRRFLAGVGTLQALFLIMILLIVWQGHLAYLVFAAVVLVTTAWATVAWLRARTELRPDGIWNQGIRRGELIPWADVDRVMRLDVPGTVVVVRRGGSLVKLAGVQGKRSAAMPTLDEITTMIEAQADRHRPDETGSPESAPPMVERRLAWGPVRSFGGVLAVIGAVFAALAVKTTWMAAPAAFFLGLAAFMVIATMRAYTRIGPDGIHNRALRKRVFIPWSDVKDVIVSETPPRTLRIVRHSGGATTLAAVRDSDAHPDGVGLDALADIIRDRAEALAPEDDTPPAEARPLSLRPSRRPLLWIVPLATASAASWWLMLNDEVFVVVGGYLLMVPLFLMVLGLKLIRGRTEGTRTG